MRPRLLRAVRRRLVRRREESGQALLELMIAMAMFTVLLLASVIIIGALTDSVSSTSSKSVATESVLVTAQKIEHYLSSAVPPSVASSASQQSQYPLGAPTSSFPCWGTSQPNPALTSSTGLASPEISSIITAHDFDIEYCGYGPSGTSGVAIPHVYRIWMGPPCDPSADTCTLIVDDYSAPCTTTTPPATCQSGSSYNFSLSNPPQSVLQVSNVWCDAYCRTALATDPNVAATSTSSDTNNAVAYCTQNSDCDSSDTTPATTPPLFTYYGASGATGGALNPGATPLMDVESSCQSPGLGSLSDCSSLGNISSVQLEFAVLGAPEAGELAHPTRIANPHVAVIDQVFMPSLVNPATAPFAPAAPTIYNTAATAAANCPGDSYPGTGAVCVTFTVPYDGGGNTTDFTITPYTQTGGVWVASPTTWTFCTSAAAPCNPPSGPIGSSGATDYTIGATDYAVIPGLTTGQTYEFTVQATNGVGTGAESPKSASVVAP